MCLPLQILRREAVDGAYELLKEETRGEIVTEQSIGAFIKKLAVHATIKLAPSVIDELAAITPSNYTGFFEPGAEVEAWNTAKMSTLTKPVIAEAVAEQRKALVGCFDY